MNILLGKSVRFFVAFALALSVVACDSDRRKKKKGMEEEHEHAHGSLIISQQTSNAISVLDEGIPAVIGDVGFGAASFVRSDNGEFAALKGGSAIRFVSEEALLQASIVGNNVVATNGHFSILDGGSSTFIELHELEENAGAPATESTSTFGEAEVFPALLLDEEHEVLLVFDGSDAIVYEAGVEGDSFTCMSPTSVAHGHDAVIMTCNAGVTLLLIEEVAEELTFEEEALTLAGDASSYMWQAQGHIFAGYIPGTTHYALVHPHEGEAPEYELIQAGDGHTLSGNICTAGVEKENEDFLIWLAGGNFVALNSEGELINAINIDTSTSATCSDYTLSASEKAAYVTDNPALKFYEIDVDEGAAIYHVHETLNLGVPDITGAVILSHAEEGEHDDHGHAHE